MITPWSAVISVCGFGELDVDVADDVVATDGVDIEKVDAALVPELTESGGAGTGVKLSTFVDAAVDDVGEALDLTGNSYGELPEIGEARTGELGLLPRGARLPNIVSAPARSSLVEGDSGRESAHFAAAGLKVGRGF